MKTHYDVLGLPRDADEEEIRVAYRNLAKIYHPDLNPGDRRVEKVFRRISEAYRVLSDPLQRQAYDKSLSQSDEEFLEYLDDEDDEPQNRSKFRSHFIRITGVLLIGASLVGASYAAFIYSGNLRTNTRWIAPAEPNQGVLPPKKADSQPLTPRLFTFGGQAPVNFAVQLVIALLSSVPADAAIVIRGVPPGASLSAGEQEGTNAWRVPVSDLFNLSISPPEDFAGSVDLLVQLQLADGSIADQRPLRVRWIRTQATSGGVAANEPLPNSGAAASSQRPEGVTAVRGEYAANNKPDLPRPVIIDPPATGRPGIFSNESAPPNNAQAVIEERSRTAVSRTDATPAASSKTNLQVMAADPPTAPVAKSSSLTASANGPFRDCPACPEMIPVRGGDFQMGSNDDPTEKPIHRVIVKSFALSRYPVTVKEWRQCVEAKACSDQVMGDDNTPVRNASWDDAQAYVAWLSQVTHQQYRLPTEAEWEYAARAKTKTRYWWGEQPIQGMANCAECGEPRNDASPALVGSYPPNPLGLYDMVGSVKQWVSDCWHPSYHGAPADGSSWEAPNCHQRILRGASWVSAASDLRSSNREYYDATVRYPTHGFRVARSLGEGQSQ